MVPHCGGLQEPPPTRRRTLSFQLQRGAVMKNRKRQNTALSGGPVSVKHGGKAQMKNRVMEAGLVLTLAIGLNAQAALFYVDGNWTGAESGTSTQPYNTIGEAVTTANGATGTHTIYIASGSYRDVANGGAEDYSAGGGSGGGYSLNQRINIYGGYTGYTGSGFDWTTRTPRTTVVDLNAASSRAFYQNNYTYAEVLDGLTFRNANTTGDGGAVYSNAGYGGGLTINNCLFTNNVTTGTGGALYSHTSEAAGPITNSDFIGNSAASGGAAYYEPQYGQAKNIEKCTFTNNRATTTVGGAVYFNNWATSNYTQVLGCMFSGNSAATDGGALFTNNKYIIIRQSDLHGNSAPEGAAVGGADYWVGGYWLENSLIYGNTGGYAIQSQGNRTEGGYTIDMANCTVVGNTGGGVRAGYMEGTAAIPMRVRNSIIADNGGYGIYVVDVTDGYIFGYNDLYNNTLGNYFGGVADANSLSANPLFMNPALNNYRLLLGSPAIDSGMTIAGITTDLQGWWRPLGQGFEMGAYEAPEPAALSLLLFAGCWLLRRRAGR